MAPEHSESEDREDALDAVALLMQGCLAQPEDEQRAELERLARAHPEHADELRKRFAFLAAAGLEPAEVVDLAIGARFGDFEPLERIASGGMGVVYRARQISLEREVALKLVRPELLWFDGSRARFRRETATIARLEHPGIVPVFAAGEERGVPYLAMQLVDGRTLAAALASVQGRAPESLSAADLLGLADDAALPAGFEREWVRAVAGVLRDVARALAHAHARGVVHRDVKPSNILLGRDGRARLIDFGLTSSEGTEPSTRSGSHIGTLHYMAPERLRGARGLDVRSDVYSCGVTLYELLALQAPYRAATRSELESVVLDGRVDALRPRNRRVDADLERVCLQAFDSDPARRYATADELADDLERWLSGEPVSARAPRRIELARRWILRHRALSASLALALLCAVGVPLVFAAQQARHARDLQRSLDGERAALADLRVSGEIVTRVLREASPAHSDGHDVTLYESLGSMAELARQGEDAPRARAQLLSMIGQIYLARSDYARAEELLALAEERLRTQGFELGRERVIALEKLGQVHKGRGELEQARARFREAAAVALRAQLDDRNWAEEMSANEAATYIGNDNARAAQLLRESLATFEPRADDADDREWLKRNRLRLAQLEGALGNAQAGLVLLDEVRGELQRRGQASARDTLELAAAESDLAMNAGDFARAERVLREALELARRAVGQRSSTAASLEFQLGRACFELGRRDEARELMTDALALRRELSGVDSPAARQLESAVERYFQGSSGR
ncbi:MAG: serine/threonine protein kinase [Planctomycetes bacterium]|nr:serine/threonine protein kinase [Planctomycetota bacterium]